MVSLVGDMQFMEHDDKPLPVSIRTLGQHSTRCHAFAKALHYKEVGGFFLVFERAGNGALTKTTLPSGPTRVFRVAQAEFHQSPSTNVIEALISINNQLQQPDAAVGILKVRRKNALFVQRPPPTLHNQSR